MHYYDADDSLMSGVRRSRIPADPRRVDSTDAAWWDGCASARKHISNAHFHLASPGPHHRDENHPPSIRTSEWAELSRQSNQDEMTPDFAGSAHSPAPSFRVIRGWSDPAIFQSTSAAVRSLLYPPSSDDGAVVFQPRRSKANQRFALTDIASARRWLPRSSNLVAVAESYFMTMARDTNHTG